MSRKHRKQFEPDPDAIVPIVALIVVLYLLLMLNERGFINKINTTPATPAYLIA